MEREDREARGEQFSFKKFLQVYKESKKAPYIVHDEETFEKFLEQEMSRKYIRGLIYLSFLISRLNMLIFNYYYYYRTKKFKKTLCWN